MEKNTRVKKKMATKQSLNIDNANQSFKAIIYLLTLLLIISFATAVNWVQYTPSPTTNSITDIAITSNGYALAITTLPNYLLYNYTSQTWTEITAPSQATGYTLRDIDKTNDGNIWLLYTNGTTKQRIIKYVPNTNTFTTQTDTTITMTTDYSRISCINNPSGLFYNKCFIADTNYGDIWQIAPTTTLILNSTKTNPFALIPSNKELYFNHPINSYMSTAYEYNNISQITRYTINYMNAYSQYTYSSNERLLCTNAKLRWFNITTGLYTPSSEQSCSDATVIQGTPHYVYIKNLYKINFGSTSPTTILTSSSNINTIDYDDNTKTAWIGTSGGLLYQYNSTAPIPPPTNETYTITLNINPNPSTYGGTTTFYCQANHPEGKLSDITLEIWDANLTTMLDTHTQENIPSGTNLDIYTLNLNSIFWTNFPIGEYIYNCQATTTDGMEGIADAILWQVTQGAMTNQTQYHTDQIYKTAPDGYQGINAITKYDENHAFSIIENLAGDLYTTSYDLTQPTNIIYQRHNTSLEQDGNTNPYQISQIDIYTGADRIFIGTNNELYTYINATKLNAEELTYEDEIGFGIFENDGINDVSAENLELAWVCQDGTGIENDDIYRYNATSKSYDNQMNVNPCRDLQYRNGYIYAHRGYSNDIQIWDSTTQTKLSTIDITKTISTYTFNDLLDTTDDGNNLYIITGKDEIRKYDVTNKSNPTLQKKCYTETSNLEITSIENLYENEIAIGIIDINDGLRYLYICDLGNNETYSATKSGYIAQFLTRALYGTVLQIQRLDDNGKFHTAEEGAYGLYYYQKTFVPVAIPNAPTISQVTKTTNTPCKNDIVEFEIFATDPDIGDTISYALSCTGGTANQWTFYNKFSCSYTTTGNKNINAWARDQGGATSPTYTTSVNVQDCEATLKILFKVMDYTTGSILSGVNVEVEGIGTDTTDNNGYADFIATNTSIHKTTFTKTDYAPNIQYYYPSPHRNDVFIRRLTPPTNETPTTGILIVYVYADINMTPLENVLVSTNDVVTGNTRYGITNAQGTIYIFDVYPSDKLLVGAKKEGYDYTPLYTTIIAGETKTIEIIMGVTTPTGGTGGIMPATPRHCIDTIKGVWLCGNLSTTGIGNHCAQDNDCISGRCSLALTPEGRECSKFNYTLCDNQGINRGNTCIFKNMTLGFFATIGDLMLEYFLYLIIFIVIIIIGLIIRKNIHG